MCRLPTPRPTSLLSLFAAALALAGAAAAQSISGPAETSAAREVARAEGPVQVRAALAQDLSAPLTLLPPAEPLPRVEREPRRFRSLARMGPAALAPAPAGEANVQGGAAAPTPAPPVPSPMVAATAASVFPGMGDGFASLTGIFADTAHPPDTDGDIGPKHYVQIVNDSLAVFSRSGDVIYGAVPTNTLWAGFDPRCSQRNDGDGVVLYDPLADRWFITQFSVPANGPWVQCIAVSRTPDPTGQYARYAFSYDGFNDYGKFGVWPDAYYATYNLFASAGPSSAYRGALACAFDRASMLAGTLATQQCFPLTQADATGPLYGGLLPADLDGPLPPPSGAPNPLASFDGAGNLQVWKFHVDWVDPSRSTLNGSASCTAAAGSCPPKLIAVPAYTPLCFAGTSTTGTCIPQKNASQQLDSLGDRPMFRLAYRNFGDHESLLMTHSVQRPGGGGGVRWYELRAVSSAGGPTLFQQGTWAPDANYRWLGSLAMDGGGNIALLYSLSGTGLFPGMFYTGRASGDAAGSMTLPETQLQAGSGAQGTSPYAGSQRWGDYANISIDPTDDCTFWATDEYVPATGSWRTAIASFQLGACAALGVKVNAASAAVARGGSAQVSVDVTGTAAGSVATLGVAGLPPGVTAVFNPPTAAVPGTSQLSLSADLSSTQSLQNVPLQVTATLAGGERRSAALSLDVRGNEFALSGAPQATSLPAGTSRAVKVQTQLVNGVAESIALSTGAVPPGVTAAFDPPTVLSGGSSTLTLTAAAPPDRQSKLAVVAQAASSSHTLFLDLVTLLPPTASLLSPAAGARLSGGADFGLSGAPSASTTVAKLELLADGRPVGQLPASGSVHLDTNQLANGMRQFSVRVTDAAGGTGVSAPVPMLVDNPQGCGCSGAGGAPDASALLLAAALGASALRRRLRRGAGPPPSASRPPARRSRRAARA